VISLRSVSGLVLACDSRDSTGWWGI